MVNSEAVPALMLLSQQIFRPDGDVIALRKHQALSVADLKQYVALIYAQIMDEKAQRWVISTTDSFNFLAGLLALFYAGKHPILLNPLHQEMDDYYDAILTDNPAFGANQSLNHCIFNLCDFAQNSQCIQSNNALHLPSHFQSNVLTLFTSGSTGLPKPIQKSVEQFEKESAILVNQWGILADELFVASVSHEHLYGLTFKIMLALANKIPFVCEPIQYQEQLANYQSYKMTYITTPSIIRTLDERISPIVCHRVISAGGALSYQEAQRSLICLAALPNEIYGSSETGVIASRMQHHEEMFWQLFPDMSIYQQEGCDHQFLLKSPLLVNAELLNDKIQFIDSTRFYLNGRNDRIVKIGEKRISLTYIEELLMMQPEILQIKAIPLEQKHRTVLACVVILSQSGYNMLQQLGHFALSQFFRQYLKNKLPWVAVPKKWRFKENFPTNAQGKCSYLALKQLFDKAEKPMNILLPQEISVIVHDHQAELELYVLPELFWFKGHFPTQPILPGVAQLKWVMHYSKQLFNVELDLESIDVIKFQIPVLPKDTLILHLEWHQALSKLVFSYKIANNVAGFEQIVSSGKLKLCQPI